MKQTFCIGGFRIDPLGCVVDGPTGFHSVEPKVMDVLCLMASDPGTTITRDKFMDTVWTVSFGSDESLTRAISILRKVLSDQNGRRMMIETVPRRGYRLTAAVSQTDPLADEVPAQLPVSSPVPTALPETAAPPDKSMFGHWRNAAVAAATVAFVMGAVHVVASVSPSTAAFGPEVQLNSTRVDTTTEKY